MITPTPNDILAAAQSLEAEWPILCGVEWKNIKAQYSSLCDQLKNTVGPAQMRIAAELIQLFEFQPTAHTRLREALFPKSPDTTLLLQLSDLATNMGINGAATELRNICQPCNPQRFIHQSNPTEATSIKLGNVKLTFDCLSTTSIFILTTISKEVVHQSSGFLQAAGIMAILAMLYKSIAVKLDEREATVLWGFSQAPRQEDGSVEEDVILEHTNAERVAIGYTPIDRAGLRNALYYLEKLKSIKRGANSSSWRIIERHYVKSA